MTRARTVMMAAMVLVFAAFGAAQAQDQDKAPPPKTPAENLCRSRCGEAWVAALKCTADAEACQRRADRSYRQCLPDCAAGKDPMSNAFAWVKPRAATASAAGVSAGPRLAPGRGGPDSTAERPWIDARTRWKALPSQMAVTLPHQFILPPVAYAYGGISDLLNLFPAKAPALLKVELVVAAGKVGIALATPAGEALVSKEVVLKPSPQVQVVHFRVGPQTPDAALLVRNRDESGGPGAVTVRAVSLAREAVLPAGEATRLGAID